jgi:hypothetical protein
MGTGEERMIDSLAATEFISSNCQQLPHLSKNLKAGGMGLELTTGP